MVFSDQNNPEDDIDLNGEVWVETKADGGKSYFYNARTRETTWTRPEEKEGKQRKLTALALKKKKFCVKLSVVTK